MQPKVEFWLCKISRSADTINKSTIRIHSTTGLTECNNNELIWLFNAQALVLSQKLKWLSQRMPFFKLLRRTFLYKYWLNNLEKSSSNRPILLYLQYYNIKCILSSSKLAIVVFLRVIKSTANLCQNNYYSKLFSMRNIFLNLEN